METNIKVLLLDVGGVIIPATAPTLAANVAGRLGLSTAELIALLYEWDPWYALSTGSIADDEYWQLLAARVDCDAAVLRQLALPLWEPAHVDKAVVALVKSLPAGIRVSILSNATLHLEDHLSRLGVATLFDPIINSARVGLRKPDPRIFQYALQMLDVAPTAVLFVDDKLRNTRAAEELGMPSVVFADAAGLQAALMHYNLLPPSAG